MKAYCRIAIILLAIMVSVVGCGSKEEKKRKFFNKGKALYEQGDFVKAPLEFKNAIQIDPEYAEAYHMLGMAALKNADYKRAYGYYGKAVNLDPELLDAHVQQGRLLLAAKQPEKASEKAGFVLSKAPEHVDASLLKAAVLIEGKQFDTAQVILDKLISEGHHSSEGYYLLAAIAVRQSNLEKALSIIDTGTAANPESEQLYVMAAGIHAELKQVDKAAAALGKLIALAPEKSRYRLSLAELWWKAGKRDKADFILDEIIGTDPKNPENYLAVARFWDLHHNLPAIERIIEKGLSNLPDNIKLRLAQGEVFLRQNRVDDSIKVFEDAVFRISKKDDPDRISAQNALAQIHLKIGDVDEALTLTDQILSLKPRNNNAHFVKGQCLLQLGKAEQAVGEFRIVAGNEPNKPGPYLNLARAHMVNKSYDLALDGLQKGIDAVPDPVLLLKAMARVYAIKEDYASAETQLRKILDLKPDDYQTMSDLGDLLVRINALARAENTYLSICNQLPQAPLGYLKLARLYTKEKKPDKVAEVLQEGVTRNPKSSLLIAGLVDHFVRTNQTGKALRVCDQAINDNPKDPSALFLKGKVLSKQGDLLNAESSFKQAIALQPAWYPPHNSLAVLYIKQGRTAEAIENLESAIEKEPKRAEAYLILGVIYQRQHQNDEAKAIYAKAIEALPDLWPAINNLAFLLSGNDASQADLKEALTLAKRALALSPEKIEVKDTLGWVYYKMGDLDHALGLFESITEGAGEMPIFQYHLGMVYYARGDMQRARQVLETALEGSDEFEGRPDAEQTLKKIRG